MLRRVREKWSLSTLTQLLLLTHLLFHFLTPHSLALTYYSTRIESLQSRFGSLSLDYISACVISTHILTIVCFCRTNWWRLWFCNPRCTVTSRKPTTEAATSPWLASAWRIYSKVASVTITTAVIRWKTGLCQRLYHGFSIMSLFQQGH